QFAVESRRPDGIRAAKRAGSRRMSIRSSKASSVLRKAPLSRRFHCCLLLSFATPLLAVWPGATRGGEAGPPNAPYGIETRVALTTSRVIGSPDPRPPLRAVRAFPGLTFANPLYIIGEPAARGAAAKAHAGRMFVVEQAGKIHAFPN